ncbi:MAG TPA: DUF5683 domain-containing protein [Chitinivibrionales bacterium]|nr:DUF5683 domain-containing protein [Chitinivibrionales bacterium]
MIQRKTGFLLVAVAAALFASQSYSQDTAKAASGNSAVPPAASARQGAASAPAENKTAPKDTAAKTAAPQTAAAAAKDTAQKAATPAKPAATLQKKKTVQEDIMSEDEEMLIPEKGVSQPVKNAQPAKTDTAKVAVQTAADTAKPAAATAAKQAVSRDTARTAAAPAAADTSARATPAPAAAAQPPAAPAKTIRIEEARPINFAKNLKEYRSPKLAMLLSLCIPGLGQAYIKDYWRAGVYVVAEAAVIGVSVLYSSKGKDKYNQATAFANGRFSGDKMKTYYNDLKNFLISDGVLDSGGIQTALDNISGDGLVSFMHACSTKTQDFYRDIQDKAYTQGWNDCQPTLAEIQNYATPGGQLQDQPNYLYKYYRNNDSLGLSYYITIKNKDNGATIADGDMQYGYSADQRTYRTLMSQSNDNYKTATTVLFLLLINHVVSAVDALISANVYNADLLGKQTFWHHIDLQTGVAGRDMLIAPGITMNFRF